MKRIDKFYERGNWALQIEKTEKSFDVLIHYKETIIFWWRNCFYYKYFQIDIFEKNILFLKRK